MTYLWMGKAWATDPGQSLVMRGKFSERNLCKEGERLPLWGSRSTMYNLKRMIWQTPQKTFFLRPRATVGTVNDPFWGALTKKRPNSAATCEDSPEGRGRGKAPRGRRESGRHCAVRCGTRSSNRACCDCSITLLGWSTCGRLRLRASSAEAKNGATTGLEGCTLGSSFLSNSIRTSSACGGGTSTSMRLPGQMALTVPSANSIT
mmetsp:Transcript_55346/g.147669  ORF Transcript_55346/g.147669 Transcript_55346/m.147669 type:complete len:205 (-) Transcript_55346:755-1369(-)